MTLPMAAFGVIASFRLRAEGLSGRAVLLKAFQQPRWWRSWYPEVFRRRGDQWDRLPREIKRFRIYLGLMQVYALTVFIPVQFFSMGRDDLAAAVLSAFALQLILLALVFNERRRAAKFISVKTGVTLTEASSIVSIPTWRITAWRRGPASTLLLGRMTPAPIAVSGPRDAATQLPDSSSSDQATRLSG